MLLKRSRRSLRWQSSGGLSLVVGLVATGLLSCTYKSLDIDETDVALTFEDEDRDYSKLRTFYVPDKVVDLCEAAVGGSSGIDEDDVDCYDADRSLDKTILEELKSHMEDLGYEEVDPDEETPDVAFFVGSVVRDNWYLVSSPGYCYDYYYWWYYGCWYPGYSYAYNLPTASILIEMAALDEEEQEASSAWTAVLSGLYERSDDKSGQERVRDAMARAFDQSPYLAEGGDR